MLFGGPILLKLIADLDQGPLSVGESLEDLLVLSTKELQLPVNCRQLPRYIKFPCVLCDSLSGRLRGVC